MLDALAPAAIVAIILGTWLYAFGVAGTLILIAFIAVLGGLR